MWIPNARFLLYIFVSQTPINESSYQIQHRSITCIARRCNCTCLAWRANLSNYYIILRLQYVFAHLVNYALPGHTDFGWCNISDLYLLPMVFFFLLKCHSLPFCSISLPSLVSYHLQRHFCLRDSMRTNSSTLNILNKCAMNSICNTFSTMNTAYKKFLLTEINMIVYIYFREFRYCNWIMLRKHQ